MRQLRGNQRWLDPVGHLAVLLTTALLTWASSGITPGTGFLVIASVTLAVAIAVVVTVTWMAGPGERARGLSRQWLSHTGGIRRAQEPGRPGRPRPRAPGVRRSPAPCPMT